MVLRITLSWCTPPLWVSGVRPRQLQEKTMKMSLQHFEFIADTIAPKLSWPSHIAYIADELAKTNPNFNREKFCNRAEKAWWQAHPIVEIDDEIPY
jgi:hypothetical protein